MNPIKKLISAICIVHCIKMPSIDVLYITPDPDKFLLPLAGMLILHPSGDVKAEYEHVCSHISDEHRYVRVTAFSRLDCQG